MKQKVSIFILLLSLTNLLSAGFVGGTLVKTSSGYVDIANIVEGDTVVCFNFDGQCVEKRVTYVKQTSSQNICTLTVSDEIVQASGDHEFYIPQEQLWMKAQDIVPDTTLLTNCSGHVSVSNNTLSHDSQVIYDISVENYHNFCVSKRDIHVHNFSPTLLGKLLIVGGTTILLYLSQYVEGCKGKHSNKKFSLEGMRDYWRSGGRRPSGGWYPKKRCQGDWCGTTGGQGRTGQQPTVKPVVVQPRTESPIVRPMGQCNSDSFIWKMRELMDRARFVYTLYSVPDNSHLTGELKRLSEELCEGRKAVKSFMNDLGKMGCTNKEKEDVQKEYLTVLEWFKLYLTETIIWEYYGVC